MSDLLEEIKKHKYKLEINSVIKGRALIDIKELKDRYNKKVDNTMFKNDPFVMTLNSYVEWLERQDKLSISIFEDYRDLVDKLTSTFLEEIEKVKTPEQKKDEIKSIEPNKMTTLNLLKPKIEEEICKFIESSLHEHRTPGERWSFYMSVRSIYKKSPLIPLDWERIKDKYGFIPPKKAKKEEEELKDNKELSVIPQQSYKNSDLETPHNTHMISNDTHILSNNLHINDDKNKSLEENHTHILSKSDSIINIQQVKEYLNKRFIAYPKLDFQTAFNGVMTEFKDKISKEDLFKIMELYYPKKEPKLDKTSIIKDAVKKHFIEKYKNNPEGFKEVLDAKEKFKSYELTDEDWKEVEDKIK